MQIVIDKTKKSIGVYHLQKARPNAKIEQLGTLYARDGASVSGVFNYEILKQETEVRNQATGFMGMGSEGQKCMHSGGGNVNNFGEHNAAN